MRCLVRTQYQQLFFSLLEARWSCDDRLLSTQLRTSENENKDNCFIQPAVQSANHWKLSPEPCWDEFSLLKRELHHPLQDFFKVKEMWKSAESLWQKGMEGWKVEAEPGQLQLSAECSLPVTQMGRRGRAERKYQQHPAQPSTLLCGLKWPSVLGRSVIVNDDVPGLAWPPACGVWYGRLLDGAAMLPAGGYWLLGWENGAPSYPQISILYEGKLISQQDMKWFSVPIMYLRFHLPYVTTWIKCILLSSQENLKRFSKIATASQMCGWLKLKLLRGSTETGSQLLPYLLCLKRFSNPNTSLITLLLNSNVMCFIFNYTWTDGMTLKYRRHENWYSTIINAFLVSLTTLAFELQAVAI